MSERHKRKQARDMLTKGGYKSGGHLGREKMIGEEVRKGVHEHESNMHAGKKPTRLKLKDGGEVTGAAFGARIRKPRGPKKPHTVVNVNVGHRPGAGAAPMPVP